MEKKWYIVHTYSGYEKHAKEHMEKRINSAKMHEYFGDILIPTETVVELYKGKKRSKSKKFFPSYIFVNMHMNDESWHLVRGTPKVTGFVGNKEKPVPVDENQVKQLVEQIKEGELKPKITINFYEGESVKVIDGPFSNFHGVVEEVNSEKARVKVMVSIFGRSTPVEFEFSQIEKLSE
jgi:transcription termination/antitermination protein NusG